MKFLKMQGPITAQKKWKNWTRNNCWLFKVIIIAQTNAVFFSTDRRHCLWVCGMLQSFAETFHSLGFGFSLWITWKVWCSLYHMIHNIYLWLFVSPLGIWALISLEMSSLRQGICDYWQNCKYFSLYWWLYNYWCV